MKELKKFKLRASKKPMQHAYLSGVMMVRQADGTLGYANFAFDPSFVTAVGLAMPLGVSQSNPAVLRIVHEGSSNRWRVEATYAKQPSMTVPLWTTEVCPDWVQFQKLPKGSHASE